MAHYALWFVPIRAFAEFLMPTNILSQGRGFCIGFVLWSLLLFAQLHGYGLGVVAAAPRRYTTTHPLRALEGPEALHLTVKPHAKRIPAVPNPRWAPRASPSVPMSRTGPDWSWT